MNNSFRRGSNARRSPARAGRFGRPGHVAGGAHARASYSSGSRPGRGSFRGGRPAARGKRAQPTFDPSHFINKNPVEAVAEPAYVCAHAFADFGLSAGLLARVEASFPAPTPIQDQIIPHILAGKDVVGLANTGTGKTAAFLIPLIERALRERGFSALILAPTRELAIQIEMELKKLAAGFPVYGTVCVGGANIQPQIRALRRHNHFVIGTPGRLKDLIERRALRLEKTDAVVLDEADRMLDMGFINDIRAILSHVPAARQTLCFSATMSPSIEALVEDFLKAPVKVSVKSRETAANVAQDVVRVGGRDKVDVLADILAQKECSRVLVFGRTKHGVEKLARLLAKRGLKVESIHGNKSHNQRQRALARFKDGQVQALIATDVAARGLHIQQVSHVINYDLPSTQEDYVHRIGRTGRGEHRGQAITLI